MIRTRTSLRDRGLQMLGIGQPSQGEATLSDTDLPLPVADASSGGTRGRTTLLRTSGVSRSRSGPETDEAALRHTWEIENLLGAEAEAAVGGDAGIAPLVADETEPLPATEWIAPLPAADFRPLPAPPPRMLLDADAGAPAVMPAAVPAPPSPPPIASVSPLPQVTPITTPPPRPAVETVVAPPPAYPPRAAPRRDIVAPPAGRPLANSGIGPVTYVALPRGIALSAEQQAELEQRPEVQQKLVDLNRAIQAEYDRILRDNVSANRPITDWCHSLLAEARVIVTYRELGNLARAEWCVEQVRARLDRAELSTELGRTPVLITLWGILWFFPFVYLIFDPLAALAPLGLGNLNDAFIRPEVFLRALFFGGLGGVAAIFYHLFKYVRERSFDREYVLSYVGKPFMGIILGALMYLAVFVAMRVLGLTPVGLAGSESEMLTHVLYMALLYVGALAVGFKENRAFGLLNRTITRLLGGNAGAAAAEGYSTPD